MQIGFWTSNDWRVQFYALKGRKKTKKQTALPGMKHVSASSSSLLAAVCCFFSFFFLLEAGPSEGNSKQTPEWGDLKDKWTRDRNMLWGTVGSQKKKAADGVKASIPAARHQQSISYVSVLKGFVDEQEPTWKTQKSHRLFLLTSNSHSLQEKPSSALTPSK